MNRTLAYTGLKIETNTEYTPDSLEAVMSRYVFSAMWIKRNSYPEEDTGKAESSVIMRNWKDTRKNSGNMWLRSKSADQTGTVIPKRTMTPHL